MPSKDEIGGGERPTNESWIRPHTRAIAFHDTIMRTSGNRIARGVVRALESQVVNTTRYMGEPRPDLCVASNRGHRTIYERIAAQDPEGAADAMFAHITEAWLVRRDEPGLPLRLQRSLSLNVGTSGAERFLRVTTSDMLVL